MSGKKSPQETRPGPPPHAPARNADERRPSAATEAGKSEASRPQVWFRPLEIRILGAITAVIGFVSALASLVALEVRGGTATLLWSIAIAGFIGSAVVTYVRSRKRRVQLPLLVVITSITVVLLTVVAGAVILVRAHTRVPALQPSLSKPTASAVRASSSPGQARCAGSQTLAAASGSKPPASPYAEATAPAGAPVNALAFSPDGKTLAVGSLRANYPPGAPPVSLGGGVYLWHMACTSAAAGHHYVSLQDPNTKGVVATAFSPDGKLLAVADGNHATYLWNVSGPVPAQVAEFDDPAQTDVSGVVFGPGKTLVTSDVGGNVYQWGISATTDHLVPSNHFSTPAQMAVFSLAVSPDRRTLAIGCYDGSIYLRDLVTGSSLGSLPDPDTAGVSAVAFGSRRGGILAAGDIKGNTYLWKLASHGGSRIGSLPSDGKQVNTVAFNSAGTTVAVASSTSAGYGHVDLWNVARQAKTGSLQYQGEPAVFSVAFNSADTTVATGDYHGDVLLWDAPRT